MTNIINCYRPIVQCFASKGAQIACVHGEQHS